MKRIVTFLSVGVLMLVMSISTLNAQEEEKSSSPFSTGLDFYSNYIWRGTKFGSGPAVQPSVSFEASNLTIGVWGSFDAAGYAEADLYASYGFDFGLSLGVTDYYYPGLEYFDYSDSLGSHAFEINAGYEIGSLSLSANYIVNEAGGAASAGGDMYFQAGYSFSSFDVFLGAGNGWHTADPDEFAVCNIGISTSKEIKITDSFSVPVSGSVILNPDKEQFFVVVGFSF